MPEQVPSQIGRYSIVGLLRRVETTAETTVGFVGPMRSTLYRGRDELFGREVTIKTLPADLAGRDLDEGQLVELRQRLYREGRITAGLNHPSVISVLDVGEDLGISHIVFEALEGRTLREAIDAGISLRTGLPILIQVLDGLAYVHANGVVHRDIKPDNIMVGRTGVAKIMNFGIARVMDSTLTKTGSVMGTPAYMSPEQASGHKIDGRSDIFSLGVVLYEIVVGQTPFHAESLPALLFKVLKEEPDMALIPGGPEWKRLRGVITRALQKKREDRYPDAAAMRADLELALKELGDSADWTPPRSQQATHH